MCARWYHTVHVQHVYQHCIMRPYQRIVSCGISAYHGCGITFVSDGIRNRSVSGAYRERIGCQYRECGIDVEL